MKKYIDLKILSVLLLLIPACNQDLLDKDPLDKYARAGGEIPTRRRHSEREKP